MNLFEISYMQWVTRKRYGTGCDNQTGERICIDANPLSSLIAAASFISL
jgi:hypothetical protein